MPTVSSLGRTAEVDVGTRLVVALESMGIEVGHRCGGKARCTTCRVTFEAGEPAKMTRAEVDKLRDSGLLGSTRLSCQILVDDDMAVTPLMTMETEGWTDPGPPPRARIEPYPTWTTREAANETID